MSARIVDIKIAHDAKLHAAEEIKLQVQIEDLRRLDAAIANAHKVRARLAEGILQQLKARPTEGK